MGAVLREMMARFSVEITPREAPSLPPLHDVLPAGTAVYLTFLPNTPWKQTVATARSVREAGMRPVPHLAARAVPDRPTLRRMLADVAAVGVEDLLVLAGSLATPVGRVPRGGADPRHGLPRGRRHPPRRHRGASGGPSRRRRTTSCYRALVAKCRIARERGLDLHLVTQFSFAPEPIVDWERGIRAMGVDVPVHVGLPGLTSSTRLLRFGLRCGVGASLKVLRQQAGGVLKLAASAVHHPTSPSSASRRRWRPIRPACCGGSTSSRSARSRPPPRGRSTSATAGSKWTTATACGSPPKPVRLHDRPGDPR